MFILLETLPAFGIEATGHPRGDYIAYGGAVSMLLDIDRRDRELRLRRGCGARLIQRPFVGSPVAPHQTKRAKAELGLPVEVGKVEAHEADTSQVCPTPDTGGIGAERYFELVPRHRGSLPIPQACFHTTLTDDEVAPRLEVLGTKRDPILEVAVELIETIVAIDILDIRADGRGQTIAVAPCLLG